MALFGKKNGNEVNHGELNAFLGVGTEYRGKLDFVGTVRIDGSFEGEISTDGTLVLGREASIKGVVRVGELNSCGRIDGDVEVRGKAVLQKTSALDGSLVAEKLVVEQGAVLDGNISMAGSGVSFPATNVVRADFSTTADSFEGTDESVDDQEQQAVSGVQ
ncbi:bactofilin family protein [Pseudodesulfovibrio senegalensis]|jgi:cytoskeletal protein CcmA (bactofilin family)|uniref:Polymer-forming cytoskeletal protein n=1 Tax=Pseudodesulfovibrio senegalensis TaxID=1721087 RepID=A0A6N6N1S7_9BACT|nr:polymer-forming cytoskeletal protein [Pseudodesulfovibrio senegalensis]KAB1441766.1 polymer-forming cytoskeletal protein [Pseudodesulfovibrio senegalensis]